MAVSKCPCLTFSAAIACLDTKISLILSIVPHSTFNLIGPCNTHPNRQSLKATKIHTLTPLTYQFFQKSSTKSTLKSERNPEYHIFTSANQHCASTFLIQIFKFLRRDCQLSPSFSAPLQERLGTLVRQL